DAYGKLKVFGFGCAETIVMDVIYTHLNSVPLWALVMVIVLLQIGIFSRMISSSALTSALPKPADRGSYMSISSSLQQVSGGLAAVVAGLVVVQTPGGDLLHFDTLGYVLVCTTLVSLALMYLIDRKVGGSRPSAAPAPGAAAMLE
ncbi:MAG: transporter, partial [Gammaproteobacteria bacterium]|nr:transporter [Gammaproteobacteria bacterium]